MRLPNLFQKLMLICLLWLHQVFPDLLLWKLLFIHFSFWFCDFAKFNHNSPPPAFFPQNWEASVFPASLQYVSRTFCPWPFNSSFSAPFLASPYLSSDVEIRTANRTWNVFHSWPNSITSRHQALVWGDMVFTDNQVFPLRSSETYPRQSTILLYENCF